jgi:cellulose synthase/poly-beta-1,6-N-acetylglucosamine synthase-like glycosyltransferase
VNPTVATIVLAVYYVAAALVLLYSVLQFTLAIHYLRSRNRRPQAPPEPEPWPHVTVQLPVYNELYVIGRLLDAIATIDYPKDRLQIQLIDDSTDESADVGAAKIEMLRRKGFEAVHIRRPARVGYKAGALQHALQTASGEFIAIFDADFIPQADFLKRTIPWFANTNVGVVQTRWSHLNRNYSLLTRLQALALDLHFSVEQRGRNSAGYFINFNGTAGVWRKTAIEDAGGWRDATLTEDLDLSYRAQLKGWKFQYLEELESPAELPMEINSLKSQQYRWNKGGAETARLMLPSIWRTQVPFMTKMHAAAHLLNSSVYLFVLLSCVLSVPFLFAQNALPSVDLSAGYLLLLAFGFISFAFVTSIRTAGRAKTYALEFPLFLSLSMGLSLHNAIAVFGGLIGRKSAFVRTPKFNLTATRSWRLNKYLSRQVRPLAWLEGFMALYLAGGVVAGIQMGSLGLVPYHVMAASGFGVIFYYSLRHVLLVPRS